MSWDITENFEYIVVAKAPPKVSFGTGLQRYVLPMDGPGISSFMRHYTAELHPNVAPGTYENPVKQAFYQTLNKPFSKYGLGNKSPRFKTPRVHQPPPRPEPPPQPIEQYCAPFNSTSRRRSRLGNDNPSPGDYCSSYKPRQMKFSGCFNGKRTLLCAVEIKCVPYNLDACEVCGVMCSSQGDYWHFENRIFLCRKHYARLYRKALSKFAGYKLSEFKSIRDCFFAHLHNSCTASIKIMKREEIEKKLRKEAYLDLYFPQRKKFE